MNKYNLLGHRGLKGEILENSQAGFIHTHRLQSQGLAGIEFDIQLTADNKLVIIHDNNLNKICHHQGRIEQLSANACQQIFKQTTGDTMLTLAEITPYLQGFRHIELEIKTHQRMSNQALIEQLQEVYFSTELQNLPIVLTSFDTDILYKLQQDKRLKYVKRGFLTEDKLLLSELINIALRLQVCQVGVYYPLINQQVVDLCHRYSLQVTAWTVNDKAITKKLIAMGVDTIISDYFDS